MNNVELIRKADAEKLREALGIGESVEFSNTDEFTEFVTSYDLKKFLGLGNNCKCIFHNDTKPSAKIKKFDGVYFYTCFSDNCENNKPMTVIQVTMAIQNKGYYFAMEFVRRVFNAKVDIRDNKYYETVQKVINDNVKIIQRIETEAPSVYGIIRTELELLKAIYMLCLERPKTDQKGRPLLSASTRYIERYMGKSIKPSKSIAVLQYFGLVEKILLYECESLAPLLEYRARDETRDNLRVISQIRIVPLDDKIFENLKISAERFKDNGLTKRRFTFEAVALNEDIFLANRLFPQA